MWQDYHIVIIPTTFQVLSLQSPSLNEILYKDGQLTNEIQLDIDLNSYRSFLHAIIGEFPTSAFFLYFELEINTHL